ncbi:hypothetical protein PRIC1_010322 [Phytophthora ramorum]
MTSSSPAPPWTAKSRVILQFDLWTATGFFDDHDERPRDANAERLRGAGAGRDELKQDNARLKQHELNRKNAELEQHAAEQQRKIERQAEAASMCQALTCEVAALKGHLQKKQDDWASCGVECGGCCEDPVGQPRHWEAGRVAVRRQVLPHTATLQHVKHVGYVCVLPADSPKLLALLKQITDPGQLWSPFGLRSLYTQDQFYEQRNAPGDNPYWCGAIQMKNMNCLALDALHHYAQPSTGSPFRTDFSGA